MDEPEGQGSSRPGSIVAQLERDWLSAGANATSLKHRVRQYGYEGLPDQGALHCHACPAGRDKDKIAHTGRSSPQRNRVQLETQDNGTLSEALYVYPAVT